MNNKHNNQINILFYRYGSICEPDLIQSFTSLGIKIIEEQTEMYAKAIEHNQRIETLARQLLVNPVSFVFSINFFPHVSEVCKRLHLAYVCWVVDCPVLELFSPAVSNSCNHIFLFDYKQYLSILPLNSNHVHYLPLAVNTERLDKTISGITDKDKEIYGHDVSFVGSLYSEKSPLSALTLPDFETGYINAVIDAQLNVFGYNFIEECVTQEIINALYRESSYFKELANAFPNAVHYIASHFFIGMEAAKRERIQTINKVAKTASLTLYTHSEIAPILNTNCIKGAKTLTEMPKIFNLSKINLNMTIKPIQSGLPLRIWDILGCGGFLLTNYQTELPEYFQIGKDVECYESTTDLQEKIIYYLSHDDERREIADNGYQKAKREHTFINRIIQMLNILNTSM